MTPSPWQSNNRALQIYEGFASISSNNSQGCCDLAMNAYNNASAANSDWKYTNTYSAALYQQQAEVHRWFTAPSGTAGNTISFTQVLSVTRGASLALQGATSQSGAGITFPATQDASSNANTLDDYEEGTWTPTAVGQTSAGTTTYVARAGNYTKIGNIATATCYIVVNGMTGTGNLLISLPFVANENYNSMGAVATYNLDWPQAGSLVVWAVAGFAYVRIHVSADNTADAIVQTDASWEATFTITYQV